MNFIDINHDRDSSKDVWDRLYSIVYLKDFENLFDFDRIEDNETSSNCKRYYIKINKNNYPELRNKFPKFKMAGDCDFNFNDTKIEMYSKFLNSDDMKLLAYCHSNHHELWNFSFMPITGSLNNTKGCLLCNNEKGKSFDRLDVFINELNLYYERLECKLLNRCTNASKEALIWYLDQFKNVFDYCKKIYLIEDEKFIKELISFGKIPINNRENAINYMNLAIKYWNYRKEIFAKLGIIQNNVN